MKRPVENILVYFFFTNSLFIALIEHEITPNVLPERTRFCLPILKKSKNEDSNIAELGISGMHFLKLF